MKAAATGYSPPEENITIAMCKADGKRTAFCNLHTRNTKTNRKTIAICCGYSRSKFSYFRWNTVPRNRRHVSRRSQPTMLSDPSLAQNTRVVSISEPADRQGQLISTSTCVPIMCKRHVSHLRCFHLGQHLGTFFNIHHLEQMHRLFCFHA